MSDNIITFPNVTYHDITPDQILEGNKGRLKHITLIALTDDGDEILCTSHGDTAEILYMLERLKLGLLVEPISD